MQLHGMHTNETGPTGERRLEVARNYMGCDNVMLSSQEHNKKRDFFPLYFTVLISPKYSS